MNRQDKKSINIISIEMKGKYRRELRNLKKKLRLIKNTSLYSQILNNK